MEWTRGERHDDESHKNITYVSYSCQSCSDAFCGILCGRVSWVCVCVWVDWVCVWVYVCIWMCVCVYGLCGVCGKWSCVSPGTAVQLSSSAAIQVFAFVFLHNRRRSSVRSVAVVVATAAVVVVDRAYIEEPSTPPSRGRRELGRRRLPVFLNEVLPEPVAFDGCRWRRWRRRLRRRWWFHLCPATWSGRIVVRRRQWRAVLAAVAVKEEW